MPFYCQAPRAHAGVPQGLKLLLGVAITCWLPTLMLCITLGNFLPLVLVLCCEVLGTFAGLLIFASRPPYPITSGVPLNQTPNIAAAAEHPRDKRAA